MLESRRQASINISIVLLNIKVGNLSNRINVYSEEYSQE